MSKTVFLILLLSYVALASIPVYVMLPLTAIKDNKVQNVNQLQQWFGRLRTEANVDGVMTDVWWGLVERNGVKQYDWSAYKELFAIVQSAGLKLQVVMSFHKCGGNVGDDCNIPLPPFAQNVSNYYMDRENNLNDEYLSWGVDTRPFVAGRTAVEVYSDFMKSFASTFSDLLGNVITEVQVGLGPAGELRYPSYPLSRWRFPGVGEFQCYDKYMLEDLALTAATKNHPDWGLSGPNNAGQYSNWPDETGFFNPICNCDKFSTDYGQFFLEWYTQRLVEHGDRVLKEAAIIFKGKTGIGAKISGIHWQFNTPSHAAELTAGYKNDKGFAYTRFAQMFASHGATMIFTCLEMRNSEQQNCNCNPEQLVYQTMLAAKDAGIPYSGENALPRYDMSAFNQILFEANRVRPLHAFTYLRLNGDLFRSDYWRNFQWFVQQMHSINSTQSQFDD